jgi:protein-disulfide isomerase
MQRFRFLPEAHPKENRLIRPSVRLLSAAALFAFSLPVFQAFAQTQVPPAPAETPSTPTQAPSAPAPAGPPVFPKPDPANFTASSPSKEVVAAFLQANWGFDDSRVWQVQEILKTPVEGLAKVVVFVGDKTGKEKPGAMQFFVLPDGKHIITGDEVIAFGEHPFAEDRATLKQRADGPYRGNASKDLEIVEFADFQCPHCKEAQPNLEKLAVDYPNARIVFQTDPIAAIHPQAVLAAEYGVCVAKMGSSTAFFSFAAAVFDGQGGLSTPDGATLTLNSAVTKAGLDPQKVAACAASPQTKATVDASIKLANDLGITSVPTLVINGRKIPANAPYDVLKKIIDYQVKLDGAAQ